MHATISDQAHSSQQKAPLFRHILLPIDGSDLSLRALSIGLELAKLCGAKVLVIHAVPPFNSLAYMTELIAASELNYNQEAIKSATGYLAQAKALADAAQVPCECHYAFGEHPYETILNAISEYRCDLIVMASHGLHGLNKLILGSETQKVLAKSTVPVLVCH